MSVSGLLLELSRQGVELWFEGDRLRFRAPKGALSEGQRAELAANKAAVVEELRARARSAERALPMSFSQQALWLLQQQAPDSSAYNLSTAPRIVSALNPDALRQALQALVDRHATLRTVYDLDETGSPLQRVRGYAELPLEQISADGLSDDELRRLLLVEHARPFDLASDTMLRATLYRRGPTDHVLLLSMHHIAADGWSILTLLTEFFALYAEANGGPPAKLARPSLEFGDYARWQSELVRGPEGEKLWEYWREELAPPRAALKLPTDHPRSGVPQFRGDSVAFLIDEPTNQALKSLALELGTTQYVVMLASFHAFLFKLSATEDITVGSPTFGRSKPEFLPVVGDFVNTVPFRARIDPKRSFRELVSELKSTVVRGLEAQEFPLPLLVQRLQPERDASRSPLFDTLFLLQRFDQYRSLDGVVVGDGSEAPIELGGLQIVAFPVPQQEGQFDLVLHLVELKGRLGGMLKYKVDLYERKTIERYVAYYLELVGALRREPGRPLAELPAFVGEADSPERVQAEELLARLRGHDVRLSLVSGKLRANAPKGALTPELSAAIARQRDALIELLSSQKEQADGAPVRVPRGEFLPASSAQERLWFLDRMEPGRSHYNIGASLELRGPLDTELLGRAIEAVRARHESLRTVLVERDGAPAVRLEAPEAPLLRVVDLSGSPTAEAEAERLLLEANREPFVLARGPLSRYLVVTLAPDRHLFASCMHHVVSDGRSLLIAFRDICQVYAALRDGVEPSLPELSLQYADFAAWQRMRPHSPELRRELEFWTRELTGAPALLELPTDRLRPPQQSFRGHRLFLDFDPLVIERVKALGRAHEATAFMTLLAIWQLLLHRVSGQDDLVVGTPVANRDRPEFDEVVGCFVNNLPLRNRAEPGERFSDYLKRVRATALAAFDHRELPFDALVESLNPQRSAGHAPLFQVLFALQSYFDRLPEVPGLEMRLLDPLDIGAARFDLALELVEYDGRLRGMYEYASDLFDEATIRRLHEHFRALMRAVVAEPEARLAELDLFDAEDARLLEHWNATELEHDRSRAVHQLLEATAREKPDAVAVIAGSERLGFRELDARANRLAHVLRARGVAPRSLVAVCLDRGADMPVVLAAVLKAGAAYVPLDPTHPGERLRYVLEDAGVACAVTLSRFSPLLGSGAPLLLLDELSEELAAAPSSAPGVEVRPDDLAYVIYTSGSTGKPKGVEVEHRNVVSFLEAMRRAPGFTAADRLLAVTTLSFDIAGLEMWLPLMAGGSIVVASRADVLEGERLITLLGEHGITVLQATPATFRLMLEAGWAGKRDLKVLCGGEALPRDLALALVPRVAELWNVYGPTETTIWSTTCRIDDPSAAISVGHPIQNTRIYVLEPSGKPAPAGVPGELCIAGEGVARGYHDRPELTAEKFVTVTLPNGRSERIYRTGDVARFRRDGTIDFLGRRDHQVKVRGYRIELGEIEAVLAMHAGVKECVVVAREDSPGDVRLVAYFVPDRAATVDVDAARVTLRGKLPEYMVPNLFVSLAALPLTPNGKIDRKALPAPAAAPQASAEPAAEVLMNPVQKRVAASWREVLRVDRVGLYDNFFDLGGHSLLVVKLHAALKREFSRDINLVDLFQWTTVAAQAERLSTSAPGRSAIDRAKERAARRADG